MDVKWKLSILVDAFHKSHGVSCSIRVTDLVRNVWTKHAFKIAFYKPTCPAGFPPAEIPFCRVSLVGALSTSWTDLNGPSCCKLRHCEHQSTQIGSKWEPDAQIPALSALPCLAAWHCTFIGRWIKNWRSGKDPPIQVTSFLHHCANGLSSFVIPVGMLSIHLLLRQANQWACGFMQRMLQVKMPVLDLVKPMLIP